MSFEVKVPQVGESITEGILSEWMVEDGASVGIDEPIFVLETDKVTMEITAEQGGVVTRMAAEGDTVLIGQVVASIATGAAESLPEPAPAPAEAVEEASEVADTEGLAPSVRRLVNETKVDTAEIDGSGRDGRVTKGDVLDRLAELHQLEEGMTGRQTVVSTIPKIPESAEIATEPPPAPKPTPAAAAAPVKAPAPIIAQSGERQTRTAMSPMRKRIAERLVQVQQQAAILTTFNEVDMSAIMALRARYKDSFIKTHGVKLGFMSFFVKAVIDALKTVPNVNGSIDGDDVVHNHYYDIGVAVSTDKGLLVPVIRNADQLSFAALEVAIGELAEKARKRRITLDDLEGGVFTITNGGVFGSLLSTPIINPPQSAILGMHGIKKRPVVVDDEIVIRPMMYLAMSYDHRLIDGRESVTFLRRIVDCLENPERMMLEI